MLKSLSACRVRHDTVAPRLHDTRDWVILCYDGGERQPTVITSRRGILPGRRIVVGREAACEEYYRSPAISAVLPLEERCAG